MFHVNDKGDSRKCSAKTPENCSFYRGEDDTRHYETLEEAVKASEEILKKEYGDKSIGTKVRYSFMKEFQAQEREFDEKFSNVSNRFYNYNIREKFPRIFTASLNAEEQDIKAALIILKRYDTKAIAVKIMEATTSPKDATRPTEELESLMKDIGITDVKLVSTHDNERESSYRSHRVWEGQLNGEKVIIGDSGKGMKPMATYYSRYNRSAGIYVFMNARMVVGAHNVKKITGEDIIPFSMNRVKSEEEEELRKNIGGDEEKQKLWRDKYEIEVAKRSGGMIRLLRKVEDAQLEGRNFKSQQKKIRESGTKSATAWMQKKTNDDLHVTMAQESRLNGTFKHIEIDDDVDPVEFKSFEDAVIEAKDKMPPIPEGKEPILRIRKLGRHGGANNETHGLFYPSVNTVTISVRNSGSYVHEMLHHYDLISEKNASLRPEFREISRKYSDYLARNNDGTLDAKRMEYLSTPTEVFARLGEKVMSERLGKESRILDTTNHNNIDYSPFDDEELMKEGRDFFNSLFPEK